MSTDELESRLLTKSQPAPSFTGPSAPPGPRPMQTTTESFTSSSTSFSSSQTQAFTPGAFFDPNMAPVPTPSFPSFDFANMIPETPSQGIQPNMLFNEPQATPFTMDAAYKIPRGYQEPIPDAPIDFDFAFLDSSMMDLAAGMNGFDVQSQPIQQPLQPQPRPEISLEPQPADPSPASIGTGTGSGSRSSPYPDTAWSCNAENPTDYAGGRLYETRFLNKSRAYTRPKSNPNLQNPCRQKEMSDQEYAILGNGSMSDPNDIPPQARDHL